MDIYRSVRPFASDVRDWEEFSGKFKGQLSAHSVLAGSVIDHVDSKLSETELEEEDVEIELQDQEVDQEQAKEIKNKVYDVLLNLTTWRPTQWSGGVGLLAWR